MWREKVKRFFRSTAKEGPLTRDFDFDPLPCLLLRTLSHNLICVLRIHMACWINIFRTPSAPAMKVWPLQVWTPSTTRGWILDAKRDQHHLAFAPLYTSLSLDHFSPLATHSPLAWNTKLWWP
jgi:hypothetical protein